jgi:hypothetical protein
MQDFKIYFPIGINHILTWEAMDHILFVAALCLRYLIRDWRKVVVLITAFTIGHSVSLALSALGLVHFASRWIEFLVPMTIVATAINNLMQRKNQLEHPSRLPLIYFFALFFGLIHGLAFAGSLISLMPKDEVLQPILAFNLGVEAAQLLVVAIILAISFIFVQVLKLKRLWWVRGVSVIVLLASLQMAWLRLP